MKKKLLFFIGVAGLMPYIMPASAVTITKAAPVATQETTASSGTTGLVSTVLGLVGTVQQLRAQQDALTEECIPSSQEINFVNNTIKEWAKTGSMSADDVRKRLGREPCRGGTGYASDVRISAGTEQTEFCYDSFSSTADAGMIWENFPMVGVATYCEDGSLNCTDKKTASDIYEIFNLIDFTEADYTASELTMAARLTAKIETCSPARLSAKKRELWGSFLTETISNLGQPTSTGTIMQQVSNIAGSGDGALNTLSGFATQLLTN